MDLFGGFKVPVKRVTVVVFTILRCVVAANLRPCLIDATTIVIAKMFACRVDQQEPVIVFRKYGGVLMHQVPTEIVERSGRFRAVNRQGKITAAFCRAVVAEDFALFQFITLNLFDWSVHSCLSLLLRQEGSIGRDGTRGSLFASAGRMPGMPSSARVGTTKTNRGLVVVTETPFF